MKEVFDGKTYYDILEIPTSAGGNDIEISYKKIKEAYSPSSPALYTIFTAEEAQQLNTLIDMAYSVLSNPIRRAEYDRSIKNEITIKPSLHEPIHHHEPKKSKESNDESSNTGKTPFGSYTVDLSFEEKIKSATDFNGEFLQKIRHYKNINLDQLCEKTKISKSYLLAMESQDFESLPAKVFVRGFVVQVAKLLNLDAVKVSNSYMKLFDDK